MKSGGIMGWQTMQVRPHSFLQKPKIKQFYFFLFFLCRWRRRQITAVVQKKGEGIGGKKEPAGLGSHRVPMSGGPNNQNQIRTRKKLILNATNVTFNLPEHCVRDTIVTFGSNNKIANGGYNGARFLLRHFVFGFHSFPMRFDSIRFWICFCFCFCFRWFRVVLPKCKWSGQHDEVEVKNEGKLMTFPKECVSQCV